MKPELLAALSILDMYKPHARAAELERHGLGPYSPENPLILALRDEMIVRINRAGAISLDKSRARAVMREYFAPPGFQLENASMQFRRRYNEQ